jgi:K+-sensing histidine kinase KdpD
MFDLSDHIKGDPGEHGFNKKDPERRTEYFNQNISCCPLILTGLSREMRTQMNSIVAFSFLLNKKEHCDEDRAEFSNNIFNSCQQIIEMFDNFLDAALIDTGNSNTESGICNPDITFKELFSEFRGILKQRTNREVILVFECQLSGKSEYLLDTNRVTRVIRNLFQNALNNTKSGYIKVGYYFRDNKLTFFVIDTGQGYSKCKEFIHSQDMNQSLTRFNDTSAAVNIVLSRKLVQIMEGSIWIERNGLEGTGIYFSVPATVLMNIEDPVKKFSNTMRTL